MNIESLVQGTEPSLNVASRLVLCNFPVKKEVQAFLGRVSTLAKHMRKTIGLW